MTHYGIKEATIRRIAEATQSWLLLDRIRFQFGPSPDGAVERDLQNAEERIRKAVDELKQL
jgi:hypothetical protein